MSLWSDPFLRELFLQETPLIDVRAPVEYFASMIPFSINLPILTNEERQQVGTCYKKQGQSAAIELGHRLVCGQTKEERIKAWAGFIKSNPKAQVFCFRGGLRSQIACSWLAEAGIERTPLSGGQKRLRQFFLSILNEAPLPRIIRIGGLTGVGKTKVLKLLPNHLDLEELACHRGSAFGSRGAQPAQASFENLVALELLRNPERVIVEDESITLGALGIPLRLHWAMRRSPLVVLKCETEERIQNIFEDYVLDRDADFFVGAVGKISKHLGGLRTSALLREIQDAFNQGKDLSRHAGWIETLLTDYYDPLYNRALSRERELIVFEGRAEEIRSYFNEAHSLR